MYIPELRLLTADLAQQRLFYVNKLGLTLIDESQDTLTIRAGATRLIFMQAERGTKPFYHFAFNISENKIALAKAWLAERDIVLSQTHPNDWYSTSWNSHALYFYDPAGNVVEFIARHNLHNAAEGEFTSENILCCSEIGLVTDDVSATVIFLQETLGLDVYRSRAENFAPLGDEHGLFIVVNRGRIWLAADSRSEVYPLIISISGNISSSLIIPELPYTIKVRKYL